MAIKAITVVINLDFVPRGPDPVMGDDRNPISMKIISVFWEPGHYGHLRMSGLLASTGAFSAEGIVAARSSNSCLDRREINKLEN